MVFKNLIVLHCICVDLLKFWSWYVLFWVEGFGRLFSILSSWIGDMWRCSLDWEWIMLIAIELVVGLYWRLFWRLVRCRWTSLSSIVLRFSSKDNGFVLSLEQHVATLTWPSVGVKPNTWKSWGFGVLWDSRMFRARQQGEKHLALGCSWCHRKGLET